MTSSILVFRSSCSYSIKALHYIGNVETQDRYPVGAPYSAFSSMDRIPGFEPGNVEVIPYRTWPPDKFSSKYIMSSNINYYKIKIIKKLITKTNQARTQLLDELLVNATDPTIVKRRIRMLKHLNLYENQLLVKIQNFQTDDAGDLDDFQIDLYIYIIINRSA